MSDQASSSASASAKYLTSTVDHPKLLNTDAASIRSFIRSYDQYAKEVEQRAKQLSATMTISTETITPVSIKFCCDVEWIESLIALSFLKVATYDDLDDVTLRQYLEDE